MDRIMKILDKLVDGLLGSSLGLLMGRGDSRIFQCAASFTSTSEQGSPSIELPSNNGKGWIVTEIFSSATAADFTAAIERSGQRGGTLTNGAVHCTLCLPSRKTLEKSAIKPFLADDKETLTFNLVNGSTATNVIYIAVTAVRVP